LRRFADWIRGVALTMGAPGLFLVAFLDSSVLSLPEITDLLVVWMVTRRHDAMLLYVVAATLGSLAGCLIMYGIGRKGGEALLRRRFATGKVDRALAAFDRFGIMVVLIPSILPPPAPFKIFVLLAGVTQISLAHFTTAIIIGRGARYLILGLLALRYGEVAITYLDENGAQVALVVVALLLAGLAAYVVWRKARRANVR
jgi:membrane protein YqaA with SNARE-associated domain